MGEENFDGINGMHGIFEEEGGGILTGKHEIGKYMRKATELRGQVRSQVQLGNEGEFFMRKI